MQEASQVNQPPKVEAPVEDTSVNPLFDLLDVSMDAWSNQPPIQSPLGHSQAHQFSAMDDDSSIQNMQLWPLQSHFKSFLKEMIKEKK